jgi:hypothetical protein
MNSLLQQAERIQQQAWNIIEKTNVINIWENIGAEINLIGSLKTGLLINHLDIDFHIYTHPFNMADSFSAIAKFAENSSIRHISYTNLLDAEDQCLEWHATYIDEFDQEWTFDLIHIHKDSPYVGSFEKVSEGILARLTAESKETILTIKDETLKIEKFPAIKIYQAVLQEKIANTDDFLQWYKTQDKNTIEQWMP